MDKDPTVWLAKARPANTCILPSFGWIPPAQPAAGQGWEAAWEQSEAHKWRVGNGGIHIGINYLVLNDTKQYE